MAFDDVKRPATPAEERAQRASRYTSGTIQTNQSEAVRQRAAQMRRDADKLERKGTQAGAAEAAKMRRIADSLEQ